jgi:hypothetical protein
MEMMLSAPLMPPSSASPKTKKMPARAPSSLQRDWSRCRRRTTASDEGSSAASLAIRSNAR